MAKKKGKNNKKSTPSRADVSPGDEVAKILESGAVPEIVPHRKEAGSDEKTPAASSAQPVQPEQPSTAEAVESPEQQAHGDKVPQEVSGDAQPPKTAANTTVIEETAAELPGDARPSELQDLSDEIVPKSLDSHHLQEELINPIITTIANAKLPDDMLDPHIPETIKETPSDTEGFEREELCKPPPDQLDKTRWDEIEKLADAPTANSHSDTVESTLDSSEQSETLPEAPSASSLNDTVGSTPNSAEQSESLPEDDADCQGLAAEYPDIEEHLEHVDIRPVRDYMNDETLSEEQPSEEYSAQRDETNQEEDSVFDRLEESDALAPEASPPGEKSNSYSEADQPEATQETPIEKLQDPQQSSGDHKQDENQKAAEVIELAPEESEDFFEQLAEASPNEGAAPEEKLAKDSPQFEASGSPTKGDFFDELGESTQIDHTPVETAESNEPKPEDSFFDNLSPQKKGKPQDHLVDELNEELRKDDEEDDFFEKIDEPSEKTQDPSLEDAEIKYQEEQDNETIQELNEEMRKDEEEDDFFENIEKKPEQKQSPVPALKLELDDDFLEDEEPLEENPTREAQEPPKTLAFLEEDDDLLSDEEELPDRSLTAPIVQTESTPLPTLRATQSTVFHTEHSGWDVPVEILAPTRKSSHHAPRVISRGGNVPPGGPAGAAGVPGYSGFQASNPYAKSTATPTPPVPSKPYTPQPLKNPYSQQVSTPSPSAEKKSKYVPSNAYAPSSQPKQNKEVPLVPGVPQPITSPSSGHGNTFSSPKAATGANFVPGPKKPAPAKPKKKADPFGFPGLDTEPPARRARPTGLGVQQPSHPSPKVAPMHPASQSLPPQQHHNTGLPAPGPRTVPGPRSGPRIGPRQGPPVTRSGTHPHPIHTPPNPPSRAAGQSPYEDPEFSQEEPIMHTPTITDFNSSYNQRQAATAKYPADDLEESQFAAREAFSGDSADIEGGDDRYPSDGFEDELATKDQEEIPPPPLKFTYNTSNSRRTTPIQADVAPNRNPYAPQGPAYGQKSGRVSPYAPPFAGTQRSPRANMGGSIIPESPNELHLSRPPSELAQPYVPQNHAQFGGSLPSYASSDAIPSTSPAVDMSRDVRNRQAPIFTWSRESYVRVIPPVISFGGSGGMAPTVEISPLSKLNLFGKDDALMQKYPGPFVNAKGPIKGKRKELEKWMAERETESILWKLLEIMLREEDPELESISICKILDPDFKKEDADAHLQSAADLYQRSTKTKGHTRQHSQQLQDLFEQIEQGNRKSALKSAIDQQEWAHALILAYSEGPQAWNTTVTEFVRAELRSQHTDSSQQLAFIYRVFAGAGAKAVDELRPLMTSSLTSNESTDELDKNLRSWRKYVKLIVANPSNNDAEVLNKLGQLLVSRDMVEEGHFCMLLGGSPKFGEPDGVGLLGTNQSYGHNFESLVLSEIYEFILLSTKKASTPFSFLIPYKAALAGLFADYGYSAVGAKQAEGALALARATKNQAMIYACESASQRCAPLGSSSGWISRKLSRPRLDKMWVTSSFNKFVSGDDGIEEAQEESRPLSRPASANNFGRPSSAQGPMRQTRTPGADMQWHGPSGSSQHANLSVNQNFAPMTPAAGPATSYPGTPQSTPGYTPGPADYQPYGNSPQPDSQAQMHPVVPNYGSNQNFAPAGSQYVQAQPYAPANAQYAPQAQQQFAPTHNQYAPQKPQAYAPQGNAQYTPQQSQFAPANAYVPQKPLASVAEPEKEGSTEPESKPEAKKQQKGDKKKESKKGDDGDKSGWFGGWFGGKKKEDKDGKAWKAKLGEESTFYFDEKLKKWVNKNSSEDDELDRPAPPPMKKKPATPAAPAGPPSQGIPDIPSASSTPSVPSGPPTTGPPSKPSLSKLGARGDLDSLLGDAGGTAPASRTKKRPARKRYVDVMNS